VRVNYQIVYVSDMKRSLSFYRDVLGIPLKFESPGWTEFATEGATLALHAAEAPAAEKEDPRMLRAGRCCAGFAVPSLADFHKKMLERRGPCVRADAGLWRLGRAVRGPRWVDNIRRRNPEGMKGLRGARARAGFERGLLDTESAAGARGTTLGPGDHRLPRRERDSAMLTSLHCGPQGHRRSKRMTPWASPLGGAGRRWPQPGGSGPGGVARL